ncbi:unnamed protein product [Meloidogyne enterolobii]|uniref:Uncharacterized protein n=2 Tax=Meloidogyne enterolobii TaxID=390850 RepID=A0A6V7Y472_MELEN|nr:unnamed protein product [Meloidogyne enterolobii]
MSNPCFFSSPSLHFSSKFFFSHSFLCLSSSSFILSSSSLCFFSSSSFLFFSSSFSSSSNFFHSSISFLFLSSRLLSGLTSSSSLILLVGHSSFLTLLIGDLPYSRCPRPYPLPQFPSGFLPQSLLVFLCHSSSTSFLSDISMVGSLIISLTSSS